MFLAYSSRILYFECVCRWWDQQSDSVINHRMSADIGMTSHTIVSCPLIGMDLWPTGESGVAIFGFDFEKKLPTQMDFRVLHCQHFQLYQSVTSRLGLSSIEIAQLKFVVNYQLIFTVIRLCTKKTYLVQLQEEASKCLLLKK